MRTWRQRISGLCVVTSACKETGLLRIKDLNELTFHEMMEDVFAFVGVACAADETLQVGQRRGCVDSPV